MTADLTVTESLISHRVCTGRLGCGVLEMKELHVVVQRKTSSWQQLCSESASYKMS